MYPVDYELDEDYTDYPEWLEDGYEIEYDCE